MANERISKSDLIRTVAEKKGCTVKDATEIINALFEEMTSSLSDSKDIQIAGFGTFASVHQDERTGRNPATGEAMTIAAKTVVKFKPATALKEEVNK